MSKTATTAPISNIKKLEREGKTIAFVTHEPDIAIFTKRTIQLRDGHIIKDELVETKSAAEALKSLPIDTDY